MKMEIETYGALPCATSTFTINGIDADTSDFGSMESDGCPSECEGYDCHNKHFVPDTVDKKIMEKYDISNNEVKEVQEKLTEILNVGDCGWCV
jgi:hypothetical protein